MKFYRILLLAVSLLIMFSGCTNSYKISPDADNASVILSELALSTEKAEDAFFMCSNIQKSDAFYIDVPDNVTEVYKYVSKTPSNIDMKKYYDDFVGMFEYLFPGHKLNENFLLYIGGSSKLVYGSDGSIECDYNRVNDWYEKIVLGEEGRVSFVYDETWFRNMVEWESPVCLELSNPIGYGYAVINKGRTVELNNSKVYDNILNTDRYPLLESYEPSEWLSYVGTYDKDSAQSFNLADKEVPICEAVSFFEKYINELPYPTNKNTKTVVINVEVYKVTEDIYGYYFLTTKEYNGLPFDYMRSGTIHSKFDNYSAVGGNAFMVESDDVDILYGYYVLQDIADETSYDKIISPESAVQIISEKMTDGVIFEAQKLELIYTSKPAKNEEGFVDTTNPSSEIAPAWKLTLYNPNDMLSYICYVDATDGQDFRYYTTPNNLR